MCGSIQTRAAGQGEDDSPSTFGYGLPDPLCIHQTTVKRSTAACFPTPTSQTENTGDKKLIWENQINSRKVEGFLFLHLSSTQHGGSASNREGKQQSYGQVLYCTAHDASSKFSHSTVLFPF